MHSTHFIYEIMASTAHISICFVVGIILMIFRFNSVVENRTFRLITSNCSIAFLTACVHNIIALTCIWNNIDRIVMERYSSPLLSGVVISICIYTFLNFMKIPKGALKKLHIAYYITATLALLYPLMYVEYVKEGSNYVTLQYIREYMETPFCRIYSGILLFAIIATILLQIYILVILYYKYSKINKRSKERGRRVGIYSFRFIIIFAVLSLCITINEAFFISKSDVIVNNIIWIVLDIILAAYLFNSRDMLSINKQTFLNIRQLENATEPIAHSLPIRKTAVLERGLEEKNLIQSTLEYWEEEHKSTLFKEGVTLKEVSKETGIPMGVLSNYLNLIYGENFYEWIQRLRRKRKPL